MEGLVEEDTICGFVPSIYVWRWGGSAPRSLQRRALMVPKFLRDVKASYGVWESDAHSVIATDGALF